MCKSVGRFLLVLFVMLLVDVPVCMANYAGTIRESISDIELGDYDKAAAAIERITTLDEADPLARKVMAVVYLHTGRLDQAEGEFRKVVAALSDDWQSHYALGLIATIRKQTADAEKHFSAASRSPLGQSEVSVLRAYQSFVSGKNVKAAELDGHSIPLAVQLQAVAHVKDGSTDSGSSLLQDILRMPARLGYEEKRGPLASFDAKQPIVLPKGTLTWKPTERKDAPVVSGIVTLKADTGAGTDVNYVSFYIDDDFTGVTNNWPFEFRWNTERYTNGLHEIKIEAKDRLGNVISRKNVWVRVANETSPEISAGSRSIPSDLADRLWNCIRLNESRKLAHYHMAKLYSASGDTENAIRHFEYTVAYQPDYLDARKLLNDLRGRRAVYREIERVPTAGKKIALTFDDGPNERTSEMLAMLARLDVKATFFVVGFRAETQPNLLKAIQDAGHQIENHTYTHPKLTNLTGEQVEAELSKTAAVIRAVTGHESRYFRPPGGHVNETTRQAAGRQGLTGVFWTINCSPHEGSHNDILAPHVINNAADGAIVLMHNGEPVTVSALPRIVSELRAKGYEFVTLDDLLAPR